EYHPSCGLSPNIKKIHEHNLRRFPDIVPEERPWEPFRTRLDFEALEFAMEVGLNKEQLNRYIQLLHRTVKLAGNDDEKFTVKNANAAMKLWEHATSLRVAVSVIKYIYYPAGLYLSSY